MFQGGINTHHYTYCMLLAPFLQSARRSSGGIPNSANSMQNKCWLGIEQIFSAEHFDKFYHALCWFIGR